MNHGQMFTWRKSVGVLKTIPFKDGALLLTVKRFTQKYFEILQPFTEVFNEAVLKYGKNNGIDPSMEGWKDFTEVVDKAGAVEVDWKIDPFLTDGAFTVAVGEGLTVNDLEIFEALGLFYPTKPVEKREKKTKKES